MKKFLKKYVSVISIIFSFISAAIAGGYFASSNMGWYFSLNVPMFTPSVKMMGLVWSVLYILISLSVLFYFLDGKKDKEVCSLFIVNAILNLIWPILFFQFHLEVLALCEVIFLNMTTTFLIYLMYKRNFLSAMMLVPYVFWVGFVTYLTYIIMILN